MAAIIGATAATLGAAATIGIFCHNMGRLNFLNKKDKKTLKCPHCRKRLESRGHEERDNVNTLSVTEDGIVFDERTGGMFGKMKDAILLAGDKFIELVDGDLPKKPYKKKRTDEQKKQDDEDFKKHIAKIPHAKVIYNPNLTPAGSSSAHAAAKRPEVTDTMLAHKDGERPSRPFSYALNRPTPTDTMLAQKGGKRPDDDRKSKTKDRKDNKDKKDKIFCSKM